MGVLKSVAPRDASAEGLLLRLKGTKALRKIKSAVRKNSARPINPNAALFSFVVVWIFYYFFGDMGKDSIEEALSTSLSRPFLEHGSMHTHTL